MVEGATLEMLCTGNRTVGSNPTPSVGAPMSEEFEDGGEYTLVVENTLSSSTKRLVNRTGLDRTKMGHAPRRTFDSRSKTHGLLAR